jgi:hypothetical protein
VGGKIDSSDLSLMGNENSIYLADCLYAFASYIISRKRLVKSKKKVDISTDINKKVLTKG